MLFDVFRFNRYAPELLKMEGKKEIERMSIGEYLQKEGYGEGFKEDYLLVSFSLHRIPINPAMR